MHFVQLATKKYYGSIISLSSSMGWACFLSYLYLLAFTVNITAYCLREIQLFLITPQRFLWSSRVNMGEGNGTPLQYSCLENPMDGGAWWAAVHGVAKSQTWLSDFTFTFHFNALEEGMATHSRVLAWRIPWMVEPVGLPSVGSHRVGHDWSDLVVG